MIIYLILFSFLGDYLVDRKRKMCEEITIMMMSGNKQVPLHYACFLPGRIQFIFSHVQMYLSISTVEIEKKEMFSFQERMEWDGVDICSISWEPKFSPRFRQVRKNLGFFYD